MHAAYWKYVARYRMTRDTLRPSFPLEGSNWFERPSVRGARLSRVAGLLRDRQADQLESDIAILDAEHRKLVGFVAALSPRLLHRKIGKSQHTYLSTIAGVAAHDVYHAGQIQLLKRIGGR